MAKVKASEKVYRAIFRNWVETTTAGDHVTKGEFVVEVSRWPYPDGGWAAMMDGDGGLVLCFASSALKCRLAARRHFYQPVSDWVEGSRVNGEWRPLAAEGVA